MFDPNVLKIMLDLQPIIDTPFRACIATRQAGCGTWRANKYSVTRRIADG
jgi:hypothetical protein